MKRRRIIIDYHGRDMTPRELSDHIFRTRGYHVHARTITQRVYAGLHDEDLVREPKNRGSVACPWPSGVVPAPKGWGAA